jgi:NFU1 iron-sulfur cluster scaffold homolog, mitochondrial
MERYYMSVLKKLSQMFSGSDSKQQAAGEAVSEAKLQASQEGVFAEEPPIRRRVIQAPVLITEAEASGSSDQILIKAEPSRDYEQCKFMVNHPLFEGHSWLFSNFEEAAGSPLGEAVFSVESVETLLVHESTAVVTKTGAKGVSDWEALAKEVGSALRKTLEAGTDLVSKDIVAKIPAEEVVKEEIQKVIDTEVNPGVAGHGGKITLTAITGNTVTILMGGGCQGCSAADLTLKQGIHGAFRKAVPYVGAIYDETDHAGGLNPYYR